MPMSHPATFHQARLFLKTMDELQTNRMRIKVTAETVPSLPAHIRMQFDELRQKWVVLAPERVLWPDDVSVDILKRCTGSHSTGAIIDALAKEYDADRGEVEADVIEFLQDWSDKRMLQSKVD